MDPQAPASDPPEPAVSLAPASPVPDRADDRRRRFAALGAAASAPRLAIAAVLGLKALTAFLGQAAPPWLGALDTAGTLVLAAALGYLLVRMLKLLHERFLWRVRRKLVLFYVLIGFVPILLFGAFFLVSGALLLYTVSSSLVQLSFADAADDAGGLAAMTAVDLRARVDAADGRVEPAQMQAVLANRVRAVLDRYPKASLAVLSRGSAGTGSPPPAAGPWGHAAGHPRFPAWLGDAAADGLVLTRGRAGRTVAARGVRKLDAGGRTYAVVADLPIADDVVRRMQDSRGVTFTGLRETTPAPGADGAGAGGMRVAFAAPARMATTGDGVGSARPSRLPGVPLLASVDLLDWSTGERGRGDVSFLVQPVEFYRRLAGAGTGARGGDVGQAGTLVSAFSLVLVVFGALFLTIETVALVMGFALARSITGAVHELFTGTERVRSGDLAHRIRVDTKDQLGELAESFNAMTGSIANLLTEAEEKRRLEEELRIAREIQMSLLPEGPASVPGLAVTAACRPAREVGGDYYEFIRLDEHRLAVLVADVSGKGTSAAFYMAELKGVVLSLSRFHHSPRELLLEVNRILSASLDSRTFITMTYAVCDLAARRLTYARAGHTPLIHVPAADAGTPVAEVLAPDGLVVGLQFDGAGEKFAELLEESAFPIETGDLVALFTDGVTEAMNVDSDLFGEERLSRTLAEHVRLPSSQLKQRILGDVEAFAGAAEQHDDMTIVLLRVGEPPALASPASRP